MLVLMIRVEDALDLGRRGTKISVCRLLDFLVHVIRLHWHSLLTLKIHALLSGKISFTYSSSRMELTRAAELRAETDQAELGGLLVQMGPVYVFARHL